MADVGGWPGVGAGVGGGRRAGGPASGRGRRGPGWPGVAWPGPFRVPNWDLIAIQGPECSAIAPRSSGGTQKGQKGGVPKRLCSEKPAQGTRGTGSDRHGS